MNEVLAALHFVPYALGDRSLPSVIEFGKNASCGPRTGDQGTLVAVKPNAAPTTLNAVKVPVKGDVRLGNREQLLRRLAQARRPVSSNASDCEVIAACYQAWGTAAFELLAGDFAFALWDEQKQRLYCVRDALGMRSIFYHQDAHRLLVAAEIRKLFDSDAKLEKKLCEISVGSYLAGQRPSADATIYNEIRRLPAGHWLEATRAGDVRVVRFWDPRKIALSRHQSIDDYAEDFRHRFLDSVRGCLRTSLPRIGLHVSGGFDSSAIVAATNYWNERLGLTLQPCAFMNVARHPDADERCYMNDVLARFPMETTTNAPEDFWAFRPESEPLLQRDEPNLAPYFARFVHELETARRLGIEVILSGAGGDEIGGSSMYLIDAFFQGRILGLWPELKARAAGNHQSATTLLKALVRALASWTAQWVVNRPTRLPSWLTPDFAQSLQEQLRRHSATPFRRSPAREHLFRSLEFCWTEPLMSQSHQVARQFGVEMRHPFLDRRLFEWALSVPPFRFGENGCVKAPLRRALADMMPERIVKRRDKGRYGHYFDLGLREKERPRILKFLQDPISASLGFVEPQKLRNAYDDYCRDGKIDRAQFWSWLTLEQWLRQLNNLH